MSPIKMFEVEVNLKQWGICLNFNFDREYPGMIAVMFGPFYLGLNKTQFWKNGIL